MRPLKHWVKFRHNSEAIDKVLSSFRVAAENCSFKDATIKVKAMSDFIHSFEDGVLRIDGAKERTDEYVGDNSSSDCGDIVIGSGRTEG